MYLEGMILYFVVAILYKIDGKKDAPFSAFIFTLAVIAAI